MDNQPVQRVDIMAYAGKWYPLYSIPTFMDKHWRETVETYVIHPDGYYAVFTTYKVIGQEKRKYIRSKLFVVRGTNNAIFKAQFVWPFKEDYWVIELADDYSYVVVGHPKYKYLFIMSRKPEMGQDLLREIIDRCDKKGYATSKLVSQEHKAIQQVPEKEHV
ncbi:lipocalin family protein [Pedobacter heparinus]|uniref:lipocalin family protein n=1 Tax=Pedobacter heparinus TaxID=984 RepID=UPI0029309021|nr:lipocalin family protein [Pedobacter heparinus]